MQKSHSHLIITRHDQRTRARANMHFIAQELVKRGPTHMFSFGFSWLSRFKRDQRMELWNRAGKVETQNGVECYLWRTLLHPVNLRTKLLYPVERLWFSLYLACVPTIFIQWIKSSGVIIIESSFPVIFIRMCKRLNPAATLIYLASDSLTTIDCAQTILQNFKNDGKLFDYVIAPSSLLIPEMPHGVPVHVVPHGLDTSIASRETTSPYDDGVHIVSVGSMLFDETFFTIAADAFPDITFHVIGGGARAATLTAPNITVYSEMKFEDTIAYLQHAQAGVAPYQGDKVAPFLTNTSMKLMQYGFLGLPSLCPASIVGEHKSRFGYIPGDKSSIIQAIRTALRHGRFEGEPALSWEEVTARILAPADNA